jgi:hypothetical protein
MTHRWHRLQTRFGMVAFPEKIVHPIYLERAENNQSRMRFAKEVTSRNSRTLDPNLTLTQTQCSAIVGKRENKNPLRNAAIANPCNAQQPLTAHS